MYINWEKPIVNQQALLVRRSTQLMFALSCHVKGRSVLIKLMINRQNRTDRIVQEKLL